MPELDVRRKYTYGQKRKKKKKKENLAMAIVSGLLPWKGDSAADVSRKLIFLISVVVLTFAAIMILNYYFGSHEEAESDYWTADHNNSGITSVSMLSGGEQGESGEEVNVGILERYRQFWEENSEFIGWIRIDPWVDYPVVQSQGDTPYDSYLKHNFYKVPTENGTVFADTRGMFTRPTATSNGRPHNAVLHGHNLRTRNLFQPLVNYRESFDFLKNNPQITFDTLFEPGKYKIFSVFQTNIKEVYGEFFDYQSMTYFESKDDFYKYVTESLDRSAYHTDVDLKYGDELLTLSTCDFSMFQDIRLVVVARRVRDDENPEMDSEKFVNLKENNGRTSEGYMKYKMFDAYYNAWNSGKRWVGEEGERLWDTSRVEGLDEWLKQQSP
jgi:sortase B